MSLSLRHYAWVVVAVTFCSLLVSAGVRAAPGVMMLPLELHFGWSRATISLAAAIGIFLYGLVGPFAAALMLSFGIKRTMLAGLALMTFSTFASLWMTQPWHYVLTWGVLSGVGSGAVASVLGAAVVNRWFATRQGLVMGMLTASAATGALVFLPFLAWLSRLGDWRPVAIAVGCACAALIPLVMLLVPETPAYFAARRPEGALARINKSLRAFAKPEITELPPMPAKADRPKVTDILSNPRLRPVTLLLAFGYMFHTLTFYYILKFAVQIVSDYPPGYAPADAASVLTYANVGGFLGSALFGFVMARFGIRWPTALMLLIGAIMVAYFGMGRDTLTAWQMATMVAGFFTNAAISGYYAAYARGFPAYARATGTGFVLGVGRLGAAGSPLLAGALFGWLGDDQLLTVSIIMAMGSIISLVLFLMLPERNGDDVMAEQGDTGKTFA